MKMSGSCTKSTNYIYIQRKGRSAWTWETEESKQWGDFKLYNNHHNKQNFHYITEKIKNKYSEAF